MAILVIASPLFALSGKAVSIHDGDTITALQGKQQIKIRLFGIDALELKQLYGKNQSGFFQFNYKENCRSQKLKYILRLDRSDTR